MKANLKSILGALSFLRAPFSAYSAAWFFGLVVCTVFAYPLNAIKEENGAVLGIAWLVVSLLTLALRRILGPGKWNGYFQLHNDDDESAAR